MVSCAIAHFDLVFMKPSLEHIENELQKRLNYPYKWGQKQNDVWDAYTNFIYNTENWEMVLLKIETEAKRFNLNETELFNYAANRWFNFWSSTAVEQIFTETGNVEKVTNAKDAEKDFYLFNIPFDHKTSVFPKRFKKSFEYAKNHKAELIEWFYKNQSGGKRQHYKNRLFIVVYSENGEHWKLKAEIGLLKTAIRNYISNFRPGQLHSVIFANHQKALSDIIWVIK